ncbi:hypothetical protein J2S64_004039 [Paeniglutamicibacter sulfureus]|uniref:Uncharacterized protein n=1 Tax=Paeniglutamicibacter sulfureus TaxID=43666 RepID=A0ABU2BNZ5_9MICC|nr:hypothetical protein [Paeniglutamicibacter sulfureus]
MKQPSINDNARPDKRRDGHRHVDNQRLEAAVTK